MAPRKKTKKKTKKDNGFWHNAGVGAIKATGSAAMGATVGAVEEGISEKAAMGVMGAMALTGLATEIFVDPEEHPYVAEAGRQALGTSTTIPGYKAGKAVTKKGKQLKADSDFRKMKDRLKADLEAEADEERKAKSKNGTPSEVKRTTKTKQKLSSAIEGEQQ